MLLSMIVENDTALVQIIKLLGLIAVFWGIVFLADLPSAKDKKGSEDIKGKITSNDTDSQ
jgi:hypothetical protein